MIFDPVTVHSTYLQSWEGCHLRPSGNENIFGWYDFRTAVVLCHCHLVLTCDCTVAFKMSHLGGWREEEWWEGGTEEGGRMGGRREGGWEGGREEGRMGGRREGGKEGERHKLVQRTLLFLKR